MPTAILPTLPFILRYPEGHELAGQMVQRVVTCAICGQDFRQRQINPEFIVALPDDFRAQFLATTQDDGGLVYQPPVCHYCWRGYTP